MYVAWARFRNGNNAFGVSSNTESLRLEIADTESMYIIMQVKKQASRL